MQPHDRARMTDQKAESASEDHSQWKLSRPAGVSTVWDWFKTFTNGHRKDLAVWNLCQTEVGRGPSSGTTNLKNHLTSYHPEKVINGVVERLQAVDGMKRFLNKDLGFTDAYVKWLTLECMPLNTGESVHFQNMISSLRPKAQVPHYRQLHTKLVELEVQLKAAICLMVAGMFVACTTDAWTSSANVAYCSLTLHYINAKWELISLALDCTSFPGTHDGIRVAAKLAEMLEQYHILPQNVMACVTDTAANMVRAARFMPYDWHGCLAHMLELVSGLAFEGEGVKEILARGRSLVGSIKGSSQAKEALQRALAFFKLPNLNVLQDVTTRWWSTYLMIARLLALRKALDHMHSEGILLVGFTAAEWVILAHIAVVLEPFMAIQKAMEGEKYVTISLVPFLLQQVSLHAHLLTKRSLP